MTRVPGPNPSPNWCHMDLTRSRLDETDAYGYDRVRSSHWDPRSGITCLDWRPGHALPPLLLALDRDHSRGAPHPNPALTGRLRKGLAHFHDWDGTRAPMSF